MADVIEGNIHYLKQRPLDAAERRALRMTQLLSLAGIPAGTTVGLLVYKSSHCFGFNSPLAKGLYMLGCIACGCSSMCCFTSSVAMTRLKRMDLQLAKDLNQLDGQIAYRNRMKQINAG